MLELGILKSLWKCDKPTTLFEIAQVTGGLTSTITTTLEDMASRGLVVLEEGRYQPLLTLIEYFEGEILQLVELLYGGNTVSFLIDFIDAVDAEDRADLMDAIYRVGRQY